MHGTGHRQKWPERSHALDRATQRSMITKNPLRKEIDANAWHNRRVMAGEFAQIPTGRTVVEVEVPQEVEEFVRKRYHDLVTEGEDPRFTDLLLDHMDVEFDFQLEEPAPDATNRVEMPVSDDTETTDP